MILEQRDEKRIEPRYAYPKTIEYTTESNGSPGFHKGVVINISKAGICLYLYTTHTEGQKITIKSNLPVNFRAATIRWVKQLSEGFYKSGLQFIQG